MIETNNRIRMIIQKLTEAIWNLDQLQPLAPDLKQEYERIQTARENLMKYVRKDES
jgi:hypothetical protein